MNSDEKLTIIGEVFSRKTSRDILFLLCSQEMYINEIATKLDIRVSLVIHHLNKLKKLGIVIITQHRIGTKRKLNLHNFYRIDPLQLIELLSTEIKQSLGVENI